MIPTANFPEAECRALRLTVASSVASIEVLFHFTRRDDRLRVLLTAVRAGSAGAVGRVTDFVRHLDVYLEGVVRDGKLGVPELAAAKVGLGLFATVVEDHLNAASARFAMALQAAEHALLADPDFHLALREAGSVLADERDFYRDAEEETLEAPDAPAADEPQAEHSDAAALVPWWREAIRTLAPAFEIVRFTVPEGVSAGQKLTMNAPSGRLCTVVVPPGIVAGQLLQAKVPAVAATAATAAAAAVNPALGA